MQKYWKRNLAILSFCSIIVSIAMSIIAPVLPIYLQMLGVTDSKSLAFWTAICFSSTSIVAVFTSPFWGMLADKHGQKMNLFRTGVGVSIFTIFMAISHTPIELLLSRIGFGFFIGFQGITLAIQSLSTPKEKMGKAMGILLSFYTLGSVAGPFLGSYLAIKFSVSQMFLMTGSLVVLTLIPMSFIKEEKREKEKQEKNGSFISLVKNKTLLVLFLTMFIYQFCFIGVNAMMTLYLKEKLYGAENLLYLSGIVASVMSIASVFGSPISGFISDHMGRKKLLYATIFLFGVFLFPLGWTSNFYLICVFRFLQGFVTAGIYPIVVTLLNEKAKGNEGKALGLNQSFIHMGVSMGPIACGFLAQSMSLSSIFLILATISCIFVPIAMLALKSEMKNGGGSKWKN